jgi:hypothetical protein
MLVFYLNKKVGQARTALAAEIKGRAGLGLLGGMV